MSEQPVAQRSETTVPHPPPAGGAARVAYVLLGKREHGEVPGVPEALSALKGVGFALRFDHMSERLEGGGKTAAAADLVVAVGGDGTVREAAAEAYARKVPLAILPLGTANDLARTLGIPLDPVEAGRVLRDGRRRRIDLGRCNGQIFCNVASLGLSAKVARRLSGERKKRWGPLAYGREFVDSLKARRNFKVNLEFRDRIVTHDAMQVGVASGETQGGGTRVTPDASIDDGLLRIYVVEPVSTVRLTVMALSVKLGAHDIWRNAHFYDADWVRVTTRRPRGIDIDGDLIGRTPAEFELLPGALEVLVPDPDGGAGNATQAREEATA